MSTRGPSFKTGDIESVLDLSGLLPDSLFHKDVLAGAGAELNLKDVVNNVSALHWSIFTETRI